MGLTELIIVDVNLKVAAKIDIIFSKCLHVDTKDKTLRTVIIIILNTPQFILAIFYASTNSSVSSILMEQHL